MPADTAEPLAAASTEVAAPDFVNESNDRNQADVTAFAQAGDEQDGHAVKLNFVNQSNDLNSSDIVIFGRNASTSFDELAVAWRVIKNCGQGWNHPFTYPMSNMVSASDSYGNYSPQMSAANGQAFALSLTASGDTLQAVGPATSVTEIEVRNNLAMGAINANIYKAGKLFASKTSIAPGQKAVFSFRPTIWIGVVSQVVEGEVMNAAILSQVNTEISLLGLASADIVMTGGGPGRTSTPFAFSLENVTYA